MIRLNVFPLFRTFLPPLYAPATYRKPIISFFFGRKPEDTIRQADGFFRVPLLRKYVQKPGYTFAETKFSVWNFS